MNAIELKNISKNYKLYKDNKDILREFFTGNDNSKTFTALEDISFSVKKGKTYGIIGQNGSGKSTLLQIISNNTIPTGGEIQTNGKVSLLNVGAGITPNYTGIQNIYYKCAINGLNKNETDEIINSIIEFSELGQFIHQPVRKYSSGMKSKLGFAIAIHTPFDILIVDEALAVGDAVFRNKCLKRMNELKNIGKTILFVSHSAEQVKQFCDYCCWIHEGELIAKGKSEAITDLYYEFTKKNISIDVAKRLVDYDKGTYYAD
ncbi:MAG: ABC transporter ATP-binding protein [Bacilli bacterium]